MKRAIAAAALAAVFCVATIANAAPGNGNGNGQGNGQGNGRSESAGPGNSGGNGKGNGPGNGLGKGLLEIGSNGKSAAAHSAKADPLHPSRLGRLNGFINASPNALANASGKSTLGLISKVYAGYLDAYLAEVTPEGQALQIDEMAAVLEQVANKPLTPEIVIAINEKLASVDSTREETLALADPVLLADQIVDAANAN